MESLLFQQETFDGRLVDRFYRGEKPSKAMWAGGKYLLLQGEGFDDMEVEQVRQFTGQTFLRRIA